MRKRILPAGFVAVLAVLLCLGAGRHMEKDYGMKITDYHSELFGENVYIFSPEDDPAEVAQLLENIYDVQESNQFGGERYAFYFLPGEYDEKIQPEVGFYTQVAGLGMLPDDTRLAGLSCLARWLGDDESNHNACCNFWRSLENISIGSNTVWAVSQASDVRRVQVDGALYLHDDYGWCSGGFLADSKITRLVDSGSQQQWLSRNCEWAAWMGENWNMVFVGEEDGCAPEGTWPVKAYTTVEKTALIREKPFLVWDEENGFGVYIPGLREDSAGVSWSPEQEVRWVTEQERRHMGAKEDTVVSIEDFYVAKADIDTADTINAALDAGKNLLLTPGIYRLDAPICVEQADTIVLGLGLATLESVNGNACLKAADASGILVAGLLFDAGSIRADNLMVVGSGQKTVEKEVPIVLSDLYFRVGGAPAEAPAVVDACITVNSDDVIGDNFWVWRADHGDQVAWDKNVAENGLIVNGDHVQFYALMVEHFRKWQTVWNGNGGRVYMYQSEIPYDVPEQSVWMSHDGSVEGYASFCVADSVTDFYAAGLGIYLYNRDASVRLRSAMELPDRPGVRVEHICTVMLNGYPGMDHIINGSGGSVTRAGERQILLEYEDGICR